MAALSKVLHHSCYELGHTWTPSCTRASADVARYISLTALKIYVPLYIIAALYRRKDKEYFKKKILSEVLHSTFFLTINGTLFITMFCLWRKILGFYTFFNVFVCGIPVCWVSLNIEARERRAPLALYMFNVTLETIYKMLVSRGLMPVVNNGEVLLFSVTTAVYMYFGKLRDGLDSSLKSGLKLLVGQEEFFTEDLGLTPSKPNSSKPWIDVKSLPKTLQNAIKYIRLGPKHKLCVHQHSCLSYILHGLARNFCVGYAVQAGVQCLKSLGKIFRNPKALIGALLHSDNVGLGAFLATLVGLNRAVNCILRWLRRKDSPWHGLIAGFISGWSMIFYKSSTIAMYVATKLIEVLYFKGIQAGKLPSVSWGDKLVYSLSTAFIFHCVVFEPHNIRPAYWRFLLRVTNNRFAEMNRKLLDVYGTQASKLTGDYWPNYDPLLTKLVKPTT